jgi:transposase
MTTGYSSDVNDKEWAIIEGILNKRKGKQGRPPPHDARHQWNGFFYVLKQGCFWGGYTERVWGLEAYL